MENIVLSGSNVPNLDGLVVESGARTYMRNVYFTGFRDAITINRSVSTRLDYCFANGNSRRGFYFRDQIGALTCSACNANNNGDEGYRDEPAVGAKLGKTLPRSPWRWASIQLSPSKLEVKMR